MHQRNIGNQAVLPKESKRGHEHQKGKSRGGSGGEPLCRAEVTEGKSPAGVPTGR